MDKYIHRIIAIIIEKTGADPEDIKESSYLEDDLNIGEIELVEIISAIEDEYKIEFDDNKKENITSVIDLVEIVMEKLE